MEDINIIFIDTKATVAIIRINKSSINGSDKKKRIDKIFKSLNN